MDSKKKILIIGASGQIGTELTAALRKLYGSQAVIASDVKNGPDTLKNAGPFLPLDVLDKATLQVQVRKHQITHIYMLAASLSASAEQHPMKSWQLNMQSLLNSLEVAVEEKVTQVFWPSSIAVFGPDAPKWDCPQQTALRPTTVYGISKVSGEQWCQYYFRRYGLDVRSLRYPGLISNKTKPGGGTTDYAVEIFEAAVKERAYTCYLKAGTSLPMMYMDDAVRATIELMEAPAERISVRSSYNLAAMSFAPEALAHEISRFVPGFSTRFEPDFRQQIADSWPASIDDREAREDWGWKNTFGLPDMVKEMIKHTGIPVLV